MARRLLPGLLVALLLDPAHAAAHAIIVESAPAVGATVAGPDVDVTLRFNSRIDRARSSVTLSTAAAPAGAAPASLPLAADTSPDILKSRAGGLAPGRYVLRWQVLSVDGHITRGDIPFTIGR
jgi:methionine-rich copper-binding protein CopC